MFYLVTVDPNNHKRVFLALGLLAFDTLLVRQGMALLQSAHRSLSANWVTPAQMHLTLFFLGNQNIKAIDIISSIVHDAVSESKAFGLRTGKLEVFPSLAQPRILYLEMGGKISEAAALREKIFQGLKIHSFTLDQRPWKCHATVARIKGTRIPSIEKIDFPECQILIDSVQLVESQLSAARPKYTILKKFTLATDES